MAINFTDSPANGATQVIDGRTYTYNSAKNKWDTTATEVTGPTATVYANVDALPTSGNITGAQAYVSGNNRLYIWNGTGWYNIALINTAPSISGVNSSYALASDGTATTVTITASDPEGLPITYSIASDTSGNIATVTQSSNVFTITPSTDSANAGTFSLTFRASDGVNIATAVSEFTLQFNVLNSNYTTALITTNGSTGVNTTFTDSSSNSHTITVNGNVNQSSFSPYRSGGYSAYFDGTDDFIEGPAVDLMGSGAFTVECWAYIKSTTSSYTDAFLAQYQSNQKFIFGVKSDVVRVWMGGTEVRVGTTNIIGEWHHIAIVRDSNNSCQLYIDGVAEGAAFTNTTDFSTSLENFEIGSWDNGAGSDLDGYITDLRVVKGTAVYTAAFTPPTERLTAITNTSLLACHLPYFADGSSNNHTLTLNGNASTIPFGPYDYKEYAVGDHGGSGYFDGNGDYLSAAADTSFDFGSGDFTVEFWAYPDSIPSGEGGLVTLYEYNSNRRSWYIAFDGSKLELRLSSTGTSANTVINSASGVFSAADKWYHVAMVRDGNDITGYVNGQSVATGTHSGAVYGNSTDPVIIGSVGTTLGGTEYSGSITDVRVVKGTAVYTAEFTPPTAPLTAITNTSLLLDMQDAVILDKSQSVQAINLNGSSQASTTYTKYGSSSMYTNAGSITILDSNHNNIAAGEDFTVEWWAYPTATPAASKTFATDGWSTGGYGAWMIYSTASGYVLYSSSAGSSWDVFSAYDIGWSLWSGAWKHCAFTREGTLWRFFLDGTLTASATPAAEPVNLLDNPGGITLGDSNSLNRTHPATYFEDFRITKGLARYTANFTPPSAALDG